MKEMLIKSITAGVLSIGGLVLVAAVDWRIAVGLFLALWGNNFTRDTLYESRNQKTHESDRPR
jgi:hypothetical protein